jgi:hypothetical protein
LFYALGRRHLVCQCKGITQIWGLLEQTAKENILMQGTGSERRKENIVYKTYRIIIYTLHVTSVG